MKEKHVELKASNLPTEFRVGDTIRIYDCMSVLGERKVLQINGDLIRALDVIGLPKYFHYKQCRKLHLEGDPIEG